MGLLNFFPAFSHDGRKRERARRTPLLVAGALRTAGFLETDQADSILQALAGFLTFILRSEDTVIAGLIQFLLHAVLGIISGELPGVPP